MGVALGTLAAGAAVAVALTLTLSDRGPALQAPPATSTTGGTISPPPIVQAGPPGTPAQERFAASVDRRCRHARQSARAPSRARRASASATSTHGTAVAPAHVEMLTALQQTLAHSAPRNTGNGYGTRYHRYLRTLRDALVIERRVIRRTPGDELTLDVGRRQSELNERHRAALAEQLGFEPCLAAPSS